MTNTDRKRINKFYAKRLTRRYKAQKRAERLFKGIVYTITALTVLITPMAIVRVTSDAIQLTWGFPEAEAATTTYPISNSDKYWTLINTNQTFKGYVDSINNSSCKNNNPGNLRFAHQPQATQCDYRGLACFPSMEIGFRALVMQLDLDQSRGFTLARFMHKYAPPHENDTERLIREASVNLNITRTTNIDTLDTIKFAQAIVKHENSVKIIKY